MPGSRMTKPRLVGALVLLLALLALSIAWMLRIFSDPNQPDPRHPGPVFTLSLPSLIFTNGSPINATLTVENRHSTAIALVRGEVNHGFWVGGWFPEIIGTDGWYCYSAIRGDGRLVMVLGAKQDYTTEINLGDASRYYPNEADRTKIKRVRFTPGKYRVKIKYGFSKDHDYLMFRPVWYGQAESNELEFEVR